MPKDYLCAAHNKDLPRFRHAIEEEASELSDFAQALKARTQARPDLFDRPIDDMNMTLQGAPSPADCEAALETCGRRLRRRWLDVASSAANRSYRSPTAAQITRTATGPSTNFGYERELQPTALENRCGVFFGPVPHGWRADHAVFSSGQAAMAARYISWKLSSRWALSVRYPQCILAHTSRPQKSLLCFLRCCV